MNTNQNNIIPTSKLDHNGTQLNLSLDELKSFFYFLNAKPDTETKLLSGTKTITLEDIRDINERIIRKLVNHIHKEIKTSITLVLSEKSIKDYSIWAEFDRENWNTINQSIESITIIN